ncbi:ArsR family transcriptional regulator [Alkalibacillus salilacus]|uniref:ArsR family transcriptional regulator n=2 Tax=Alkalibacillus salilacus TaxID=284582 RepID=A0ABT9VBN7_9BACI|nr:ArsR family transcriptional regulator [Alkalibacillus salilacus]
MSMYNINYNQTEKYSEMFKALSNPYRLKIFLYLATHCRPGELSTNDEMRYTVGELGEDLEIAQSTVSHHLKELRQSGLIRMERKSKNVECWVEQETLDFMTAFFEVTQD